MMATAFLGKKIGPKWGELSQSTLSPVARFKSTVALSDASNPPVKPETEEEKSGYPFFPYPPY